MNNSALNPHLSSPNRKSKTSSISFAGNSLMGIQLGTIVTTMMCVRATAQTWTPTTAPASLWASVASSADGTKLVAAAAVDSNFFFGQVYTSVDSGASWTVTSTPQARWEQVACSADGTRLVAVASGDYVHNLSGPIYTSFNSGATWTQTSAPLGPWKAVSSSADGTELVAAQGHGLTGLIYVS